MAGMEIPGGVGGKGSLHSALLHSLQQSSGGSDMNHQPLLLIMEGKVTIYWDGTRSSGVLSVRR